MTANGCVVPDGCYSLSVRYKCLMLVSVIILQLDSDIEHYVKCFQRFPHSRRYSPATSSSKISHEPQIRFFYYYFLMARVLALILCSLGHFVSYFCCFYIVIRRLTCGCSRSRDQNGSKVPLQGQDKQMCKGSIY